MQIRDVENADLELFYEHQLDPVALQTAAFSARERPEFLAHWDKVLADPSAVTQAVVEP